MGGNGELTIMYGSRRLSTPFENPGNSVLLRIEITFDNFPEDTSWMLKNTCILGGQVVGTGGGYGQVHAGGTHTVFAQAVPDGTFQFTIEDVYGDGLCCAQGSGSYTIFLDGKVAKFSKFETTDTFSSKKETESFGSVNKCG